jgi:ABC-type uncharacterized transport system YnjBCD substrate-binding protein
MPGTLGPLVGVIPDSDKLDAKLSQVQEGYATGGYLVPVYRNQTGFVYDPEKVPTPPQSWEEFTAWLDANPGQFAFNDPSKGGSGQAFVQARPSTPGRRERYAGDTELMRKVADWGKVWDWFNANQDKFTITASNNDSLDRVNQGEVLMAAAWDDDTSVSLAKGTLFKRAKLYIPSLGMPGGGDSLGIPANAPHKAAALLWVAYLVEADVQKQTPPWQLSGAPDMGARNADPRRSAPETAGRIRVRTRATSSSSSCRSVAVAAFSPRAVISGPPRMANPGPAGWVVLWGLMCGACRLRARSDRQHK